MMRLHHAWQSRSGRSLWLLHEIGLEFELVVHSFDKSLYHPDYLRLNPAGRVPALEDGDLVLFETGAICEYLCETYAPDLWRGPGHGERVDWLQWLHFSETVAQHLASLTQQHIVLREDWMRSPTLMKLERMRLERTLGAVEAQLAGQEYILPSGFCGVDTSMGYGVNAAELFTDVSAFPNLSAYLKRLRARPAFAKTLIPAGARPIYAKPFYATPDA